MILIIMRNFNWSSSVINLTPGGMVPTAHSLLLLFKEHKSQHSCDKVIVTQNNKTL